LDTPGASLNTFWIPFYSVNEITFILAIIFCREIEPVRNWLLILFAIHFAARVWTLFYFAPNIIDFKKIATGAKTERNLLSRTSLWRKLNYIRAGIFMLVSIGLIPVWYMIQGLKLGFL
jgi:hypothetical protein